MYTKTLHFYDVEIDSEWDMFLSTRHRTERAALIASSSDYLIAKCKQNGRKISVGHHTETFASPWKEHLEGPMPLFPD